MSEQEFRNICELDDIAEEAGGYVDSTGSVSDIHYDYRAIIEFCRNQGREPADMTIRELQQFIIA